MNFYALALSSPEANRLLSIYQRRLSLEPASRLAATCPPAFRGRRADCRADRRVVLARRARRCAGRCPRNSHNSAPSRSRTREGQLMHADYVIVGAGSAGCAMAYRLTEAGHSVIVIEYGGSDAGPLIQMPGALSFPMNMKRYDWGYQDRTRALSWRSSAGLSARQGSGRLVVDQRHGLCARPCRRL